MGTGTNLALLQPVVVLAAWTMIMLVWTLGARMPALKKAGIDLGGMVGGKGTDADRVLPARTQWPSHNYNHLLEQPTAFYAVAIVLALAGANDFPTRVAVWGYVTFRIVHSIWQASINRVSARFGLFAISSMLLFALAVRAGLAVWEVKVPW
ncbi:MAPEG family protein [Sphingomonas sp.]|uniref:MAPEG family protein n=1 Tax=Sphingomonas sp. TaxID=28214 RepID=UPI003AFFDDA5